MKKKKKFQIKSKHLLVLMTGICISAIALTVTETVSIAPLRDAAGMLIVPFQNGLNQAGGWLSDVREGFRDVQELSAENEELKEQVERLSEENSILSQNQEELRRLRELYQLDGEYTEYDKIGAEIISRDAGNWYSTFIINKGSDDGIAENMNVISGGGLVGIVTETGKNWASVRTIIDDSSNVSAMTVSTSDTCIVSGDLRLQDEGKLSFDQMNTENQITVGEQVVTSNISSRYLPGILIGYVDEVTEDSNHLTKTGYLIPAVDFQHIQEVLVITELKDTGGSDTPEDGGETTEPENDGGAPSGQDEAETGGTGGE
jgi:rod shape-determining protein MreC